MDRVILDYSNSARKKVEAEIGKALNMENGLQVVAASITDPVKTTMDIKGVMRKLFVLVTNFPKGQRFEYETDICRLPAITTARGPVGSYNVDVRPDKVYLDTATARSLVYVARDELYEHYYDVLKRVRERVQEGLIIREENILLGLLDAADASALGNATVTTTGALTPSVIAKAQEYVENQNLDSKTLLTNPSGTKGFRYLKHNDIGEKGLDEILKTGYLGSMFGLGITSTTLLASGSSFVLASPEYVGRYYLRMDHEITAVDKPEKGKTGFVGEFYYAASVHGPKSVTKIEFNAAA